jgi:hypothetical protein
MGNATDAAVCRRRGLAQLGRLLARDRTDIGTALTSRLGCVQRTERCICRLETSH